jgi:hypothetical protein
VQSEIHATNPLARKRYAEDPTYPDLMARASDPIGKTAPQRQTVADVEAEYHASPERGR